MAQPEEKVIMTKVNGKWYINTPNFCTSCHHTETCKLLSLVQGLGRPWFEDSGAATRLGSICDAYLDRAINEIRIS